MTLKQIEKLKAKITKIKRTLAAEKRKLGVYDDSRGYRYLPTRYFIQLGDYKGGMTYLTWFQKNFPDDMGYPDFLFEWTILLYKCGKIKEAEKKAFETFCANTYLFDKYFDKPIYPIDKCEGSNLETIAFAEYFNYSSKASDLADFSDWLEKLISSENFKTHCDDYIDIHKRLNKESDTETRHKLLKQARQLEETF